MQEFFKRIDVDTNIDEIAKAICLKCSIKNYESSKIVEVGYEDFNFIMETSNKKYLVKIFHKGRTNSDCSNYMDRIRLSNKIDINTPKLLFADIINISGKKLQFVVLEYINGKSFMDLGEIPSEDEIKEIIRQMANIHKAELKSDFIYDAWAIINFTNELNQKEKYLDKKYVDSFRELSNKLQNIELSKLPHSFVHGDIISSNVIKDDKNKLWIIDFAVSNYLPRIIDIVVTGCNLCTDPNSKENTIKKLKLIIDEYDKYNQLTNYEKETIPLLYDIGNAMGILQIDSLKKSEKLAEEDEYWIKISEQGLRYSDSKFWSKIFEI